MEMAEQQEGFQAGTGRLYIIRHGRTDWNTLHRLQGQTDIPLNQEGRKMAADAREACRDIHFDLCYSSLLSRAHQTAEILLEGRDVPIIIDRRLIEMSFGEYEGLIFDAQPAGHPINDFFGAPEKYMPACRGAETFEDLFRRTGEFLRETAEPLLAQGKSVLIAGHIAMNSSIICRLRGIPLDQFWSAGTDNCKLTRLI